MIEPIYDSKRATIQAFDDTEYIVYENINVIGITDSDLPLKNAFCIHVLQLTDDETRRLVNNGYIIEVGDENERGLYVGLRKH